MRDAALVEELSERERAVLDLEGRRFKFAVAKAAAVRELLGLSLTSYYQLVNALIDDPRALQYAPSTVYRLRRLRDRRRGGRAGARPGCGLRQTQGGSAAPTLTEEGLMPAGDIETYHADGSWHSKVEGTPEAFSSGGTKEEQVAKGRARAQADKVEHIIKDLDGTIAERNSYGHDPRNVAG